MDISDGWGARLREERERAGLAPDAFGHRNTQRFYESEERAPDIRYLRKIGEAGLDVGYILTGNREIADSQTAGSTESELLGHYRQVTDDVRAGLLALARAASGPGAGAPGSGGAPAAGRTLHDKRPGYRPED